MKQLYAKILLFGEYSVLKGSSALTTPCKLFSCSLQFPWGNSRTENQIQSNEILLDFQQYLKGLRSLDSLNISYPGFYSDLLGGMYLQSNIPSNYGLGSSGALVAAVFERYVGGLSRKNLFELKTIMAEAESFFHGESSGMDPLSSYLDAPVLVQGETVNKLDPESLRPVLNYFYLFDTGKPGATGDLVQPILKKMNELPGEVVDNYLEAVNSAIDSSVQFDPGKLEQAMLNISGFQKKHFPELIPQPILKIWLEGIQSKKFFFKLCGSGGGGYMLIYSHLAKDVLEEILNKRVLAVGSAQLNKSRNHSV